MAKVINMIGKKYGRLTVQSFAHSDKNRQYFYHCSCDCGNVRTIPGNNLRSGNTTSCGCYKHETLVKRRKHGGIDTREYRTWLHMRRRCLTVTNADYPRYGGRGITICSRWDDFANFLADMGPCPTGYSIDRIDNNGNYAPLNCRWANFITQNRNRRLTVKLTFRGQLMPIAEYAELMGLTYNQVRKLANTVIP
jgi:hypothetical protein